ncbi:MAG TPA: spore coat protein CotJB [Candidatus Eubacterium avistercoris]|uniref:Spore coat protein CotJB n=1 Tax=Candidatus Eubacterium avistercoris TaxID=2838567 RepID=A0A9D2IGH7_9FIRM|nr:spore coat protein CotJB [Candidatus Eubacterium avistercoris]
MDKCCTNTLAIASVPCQETDLSNLYTAEEALCNGTIFPELNLPFFITETDKKSSCGCLASGCCRDMMEIMKTGFYLDDLTLYLDTHPQDKKALALMQECLAKKQQQVCDFAKDHFVLTKNCIPQAPDKGAFAWSDGPAPWEGVYE